MSIFSNIQKYAGNWSVDNSRNFTDEEKNEVIRAVVTESEKAREEGFGKSVCFFFKDGQQGYIPLSTASNKGIGETVDLNTAKVLTLKRGDDRCTKIEC